MEKNTAPPPPPPPAPALGVGAGSGRLPPAPNLVFNPKDLQLGLRKLKRPDQIKKLADVSREDIFDKFHKYNHIPLVDSREYLRTIRADIVSISLNGVEQLTDAFLYSLYHCKISLPYLQWISLGGCYNITDEGIYWTSLAFPSMKSLSVEGCTKVTEKSLFYLQQNCLKMENLNLCWTSCGVLPLNTWDPTTKLNVSALGCPLISPDTSKEGEKLATEPVFTRKMVILTNGQVKVDPLTALTNEKGQTGRAFVYKAGWQPFQEHDKFKGTTFNIFQIPHELGVTDLFLSPGCLVVLPFMVPVHQKNDVITQLASTILTILTKCEDCMFVLLGLSVEPVQDEGSLAQDVYDKVQRKVTGNWKELSYAIRNSIYTNWRMENLDFHEQQILSNGVRLKRQVAQLFKIEDKKTTTPLLDATGVTCVVMGGDQKSGKNFSFLETLIQAEEILYPWLRQPMRPQKSWHTGDIYTTLTPLVDLCALPVVKETFKKRPLGKLQKAISVAALQGETLFFSEMFTQPLVSDFAFLSNILDKLLVQPAPRSCDIRCFGNKVPCWKHDDIANLWPKGTKGQVATLVRVLEKHGCLMRFVLDEWSDIKDVSHVYICYKDFPAQPPPHMASVWPDSDSVSSVVHKEKVFVSHLGLPQSFFPNVIRHALKLGGHVCVWREGMIIDRGLLSILIERHTSSKGEAAILVQVRTLKFSDDLTINSTWLTLNLYTTIIDYLAQVNNIFLAKMLPCIVCMLDLSRPDLVQKAWQRKDMYMEHIVRSGDNRDLKCTCGVPTNSRVQLGITLFNVRDMVPLHNTNNTEAAKEWSSNFFNRCLLCHNCVANGDQCQTNLLQGTANWHCKCEKWGNICDYCGMCTRCALYLKKIASTMEPKFEAPKSERYAQDQLKALDEVAITEKGSIIGFIDRNVIFPMELSTLTPNYCPCINITLIKKGYFSLKLELLCPTVLVLTYHSQTGQVQANGQSVVEADPSRALELGDTINISVTYTMTSINHLLPKCEVTKCGTRKNLVYGQVRPKQMYVGNLPDSATTEQLFKIFSKHGKVEEVVIPKTAKGFIKGFAFVLFEEDSSVKALLHGYDEKKLQFTLDNKSLIVSASVNEQRSFSHMELSLKKNGVEFYSTQVAVQEVTPTLSNHDSEGLFVQIETPGKFRPDPAALDDLKKNQSCGRALIHLPSAIEMQMYNLLDSMEDVLFGGAGVSLSGAAALTLPSQLTANKLRYPIITETDPINYHPLCLSWNPMTGKGRKQKARFVRSESSKDQNIGLYNYHNTYSTWNLNRLIHLVDSEGIPGHYLTGFDVRAAFLLLAWHFIFLSYPRVLLPEEVPRLLPEMSVTPETEAQVLEGIRGLVRAGFWMHFSRTDIEEFKKLFKATANLAKPALGHRMKIVEYTVIFKEKFAAHTENTGLLSISSRFNSTLELFMCSSHSKCLKVKEGLPVPPPELCGTNAIFISFLDLSFNKLTEIPSVLFEKLVNLVDLKMNFNFLEEIPASITKCKKLCHIAFTENNLTDLPEELVQLKHLLQLEVGANRFRNLPPVIFKLTGLRKLMISNMLLAELPEEIGNLINLRVLFAHGNCFTKLPHSFMHLLELEELYLGAVPYIKVPNNVKVLTFENFKSFLKNKNLERWIEASSEDRRDLFYLFDENANGVLEENEIGKLNAVIFNLFPRFGYKGSEAPDDQTSSGFPLEILSCSKLRILQLQHHGFTNVPREIRQLQKLMELNISFNPNLLSVPAELSLLPQLTKLGIDDCPLLKTPPLEIRKKGFHSCIAYLQRLIGGAVKTKRTKLMLVGLGGAGKTSLVEALLSDTNKADLQQGGVITDGIDIKTWHMTHNEDKIVYNVWDFAGQTVYYNTHQFFLSTNRAIYFLLWNVRLGYEHAGLDFWLNSIKVQAPNTPIFIVGSHIDQVSKAELPLEEIQAKYSQISGFHFISSYTGQGISELKESLLEVTLQQQYMGEDIPSVWLTLEELIKKTKQDIVDYDFIKYIANKSGIFEESEIFEAVQFLHDLGSVQHFTNDFLKTKVVINPQWIVDAMACVVSVKNFVVKDGRLKHEDISNIWSDYDTKLHQWLLRLTEEFDLTFPLNDEPVNLVPCLMPDKKPKIAWPELERGSDLRESRMVYKFDYLPAGLFNRGQVRLHNLSESSLIWKKGSFLKKNVHIALLHQVKDSQLEVLVQGPRPENILFLVHEVFESLITESFKGVKYDFSMPCPDCQRTMLKEPHMFDASTIRRAIDMKAPFLQCVKSFHTISCSVLLTLLPPDNHTDFDAHLVQTVQGLKDLRKDISTDIFIACNQRDLSLDESVYITPNMVYKSLMDQGYRCWIGKPSDNQSTDDMYKALIDCSVFVAFVSVNYAEDEECVNTFKYARLTLKKNIVVVAIGDGFEWKKSKLGILLADEVFVNMIKAKLSYYDQKFEELVSCLKGKTRVVTDTSPKPAVFFSYTWVNSADAVAKGTRALPGAVGYGDPRDLKQYLEENGITCWIDVERVGMNGLFDDIAEGLLSAKVVIVCVSDEYASSPTCQIEFRYAATTLKLPIIIAAVGTSDHWRSTEVGLLSVNFPLVNFQEETKTGKSRLLKLVRQKLGEPDDPAKQKAQKNAANSSHKNLSYQELFELAQRKLLRQLSMFAEHQQDIDVYPRLFVVDIMKDIQTTDDEEGTENTDTPETKDDKKQIEKKQHLSRHSSTMLPAYQMQKFCVYTLCEHDEGWHHVTDPIELPADFGMNDLTLYSPYLARMTTVMKYSKKIVLNCLTDDVGKDYLDWLEKSPDATISDYQRVYHQFREMVRNADTNLLMGDLMRCHLTNGRTIWLCKKHRESMRVTCLSNEQKSSNHMMDSNDLSKNWLLTSLRAMDDVVYTDRFEAVPLAKRIINSKPDEESEDENMDDMDGESKDTQKKGGKERKKHDKKVKDKKKPDTVKTKEPVKSAMKSSTADESLDKPKVKVQRGGVKFALEQDTYIDQTEPLNQPNERPVSAMSTGSASSDVSEPASVSSVDSQSGQVLATSSSQLRSRNQGQRRRPIGRQPIYGTKGGEKSSRACHIS